MKLSTKLLLSYLAIAFLVLIVGAGSYILNRNIKDRLIEDSQSSITEMQRLSNLEFNLLNSLLFTRNFLFEKSRERDEDPSGIQLKSRGAEAAARDHLSRFSANLDSIRAVKHDPALPDEILQVNYRQLDRFADSLSTSFELYRSLIFEIFELEEEVGLGDEMFNMTVEPYFRTTLMAILDSFRMTQSERVDLQMASLRSQAEQNTRVIVFITVIAFFFASLLAWLIYNSIARPLNYLTLATEEIGSGNLEKRIRIGTNDELDHLGQSFNKMAENLNRSMVSREYVNNIIQSMGDMLVVTNSKYDIELINKSISETVNYEPDELTGKKFWMLIGDEYVDTIRDNLIESRQKKSFEATYKTRDGREIPVILSFSYLQGKNGNDHGIVLVASNITAQKEAEEKVSRSLREKEVLLAEIHHRVKNNLAVISGLLEMQVWGLPDEDKSIGPLKESQLRIHSIALVHELLYQSETFSEIKLDEYIVKLLQAIGKTHKNSGKAISVSTELEPVRLTIHKAIPVSLLFNELIVNSYKHAFTGQSGGQIKVHLTESDNMVELAVQDDGVGLPPEFDLFQQHSLGMTLIKTLVRQLNAKLHVGGITQQQSGARFVVHFEKG